jgi:putative colanic acid biosynthesis UDP-glucose lipid carrier transferase
MGARADANSIAAGMPAQRGDGAGRNVRFDADEPAWLGALLQVDLLAVILTLFVAMLAFGEPPTLKYALFAIVAVVVYSRVVTPPPVRRALMFGARPAFLSLRLLAEWSAVGGLLLLLGFVLKVSELYSRAVVLAWFAATPLVLVLVYGLQLRVAATLNARGALATRYVILGANEVGFELARRLNPVSFRGFFDFRAPARVRASHPGVELSGGAVELADFVRSNGISAVYIALPIANAPRVKQVLTALRDSTASVYFVPDVFAFDLIQARIVDLNGMPALAVCDTPMRGSQATSKRVFDLVLASAALVALAPLLAALAIAVRLTSAGPVLFRQRRYGMDGRPIEIMKLRTMTVCEDGAGVVQARRGDARVTPLGRVLRRTSLDELPQLFNVLRGEMSLVGPRPHAVAHNEQYRKLISGYMLRHKALPGMTGWAQVHGLRGETDTLEKMERRVHYDLDYLANWSLMLDVRILVRTVRIVLRGENAH